MRDVISLEFAKFPVRFPVSREFCGRLARTALHRQPRSPPFLQVSWGVPERAANSGAFTHLPLVSTLPFGRFGEPIPQKSPAVFGNIPVFRRLPPETWFERHGLVRAAAILANSSSEADQNDGGLRHAYECDYTSLVRAHGLWDNNDGSSKWPRHPHQPSGTASRILHLRWSIIRTPSFTETCGSARVSRSETVASSRSQRLSRPIGPS